MALWFDLMVNTESIGQVQIQRVETGADGRHRYRWRVKEDGCEYVGSVYHREGDGAFALAASVLIAYRTGVYGDAVNS